MTTAAEAAAANSAKAREIQYTNDPRDVTSRDQCIYNGMLVETERIDAFRRKHSEVDDALAQQVMNWVPAPDRCHWMQESNNDCTGFVRFFTKDAMPDTVTLWQPSRNMNQARMCLDWMANGHESRNGNGRPRIWISFQITPFHVIFTTHNRARSLFCASYAIDGSDMNLRFAIGVLVSHNIVYNDIVRAAKAKKRDNDEACGDDVADAPECFLEQLRHEVHGLPDSRIDENARRKRQALDLFYSKTEESDVHTEKQ